MKLRPMAKLKKIVKSHHKGAVMQTIADGNGRYVYQVCLSRSRGSQGIGFAYHHPHDAWDSAAVQSQAGSLPVPRFVPEKG